MTPKHCGPINRRRLPNTKRKDDPPPNAPPTSYFSSICQCHSRQAKGHTHTHIDPVNIQMRDKFILK